MLVGLDRSITRLVEHTRELLGEDTVIVITPDNGGSVWFGGNNEPLRSGKVTPFEGGVRVPCIVMDLGGAHLGLQQGREFHHMVHISDWLPTFLDWAGTQDLGSSLGLDGVSQATALRTDTPAREEVLLELFHSSASHDGSETAAYRRGKYKIITGHIRDPHWYTEPRDHWVATSDPSILPKVLELIARGLETVFGNGPTDRFHLLLLNGILFNIYKEKNKQRILLYDLETDPEERRDISLEHPQIVKELTEQIEKMKSRMHPIPRYWMVSPNFTQSFIPGDCQGQDVLSPYLCRFAHHWIPDTTDVTDEEALQLFNALDRPQLKYLPFLGVLLLVLVVLSVSLVLGILCCWCRKKGQQMKHKQS